jgi:putative phosphoribosyl transferase
VPEVQRCKLEDPIILGLPRGGIPLAYEIAVALHAPLDTIVVRKLGVPSHPELAFGAIASGGIRVINEDVIQSLPGLDEETIETIAGREMRELRRRERAYRLDRPYPELGGRGGDDARGSRSR